jgi:S-adenosylmethionine:tRNA ribosyltransferase-isomerase
MTVTLRASLPAATAPIESTGRERHDVSLLVAADGRTIDTRFHKIGDHLHRGDVLVVNTSATEPSALRGRLGSRTIGVHISGPARFGDWIIELREPNRSGPILDARQRDRVALESGAMILVEAVETTAAGVRLWRAGWLGSVDLVEALRRSGRPIRYGYVPEVWSLDSHRTVFERRRPEFSSAEMPSAARPFTHHVVGDLLSRGVEIVEVTLHAGVSSPERHERPLPERFAVDRAAANRINRARARGGRVVAVGTTSTRAVESAVSEGSVVPKRGWTDLVLSASRPTAVVSGLVTGWHPPEASHLDLLEAVAGVEVVSGAYRSAHELAYRSHEFGDSCLLLPPA